MITDAAVEAATAVLEERGWERDEEMVQDVRAALEAAQAEVAARRPRRSAASPASARGGRPRAGVRRAGDTSRPRPAPADGRVPEGPERPGSGTLSGRPPLSLADGGAVAEKGPGPKARPVDQGG